MLVELPGKPSEFLKKLVGVAYVEHADGFGEEFVRIHPERGKGEKVRELMNQYGAVDAVAAAS